MLFWVWDETDGRDSSFTNFDVINNPVEAWLASFYITTLAIQGFGYGRYVADSQLSETWIAIVNTLNPIVFGMVISSFVILALEFVKTNYSNQRQAKNYV